VELFVNLLAIREEACPGRRLAKGPDEGPGMEPVGWSAMETGMGPATGPVSVPDEGSGVLAARGSSKW
jgi:hypothetical protein